MRGGFLGLSFWKRHGIHPQMSTARLLACDFTLPAQNGFDFTVRTKTQTTKFVYQCLSREWKPSESRRACELCQMQRGILGGITTETTPIPDVVHGKGKSLFAACTRYGFLDRDFATATEPGGLPQQFLQSFVQKNFEQNFHRKTCIDCKQILINTTHSNPDQKLMYVTATPMWKSVTKRRSSQERGSVQRLRRKTVPGVSSKQR